MEVEKADGTTSPFPLIRCRNVYMLPGVPNLLREKWKALKEKLVQSKSLPPYHNVVLKIGSDDETVVTPALEAVTSDMRGLVEIGSYPVDNREDGVGILISLASKDSNQLEEACNTLREMLPKGILVGEDHEGNKTIRN